MAAKSTMSNPGAPASVEVWRVEQRHMLDNLTPGWETAALLDDEDEPDETTMPWPEQHAARHRQSPEAEDGFLPLLCEGLPMGSSQEISDYWGNLVQVCGVSRANREIN